MMDRVSISPEITESTRETAGIRSIAAWSVWIGLGSGTLELIIFWLKCHYFDPRNMNVSRHFIWMFPVAGFLAVFVSSLSVLIAYLTWKRARTPGYALFPLFFVAYVGLTFRAPVYTWVCLLLSIALALRTSSFVASHWQTLDRAIRRGIWIPLGLLVLTVAGRFGREYWIDRSSERPANSRKSDSKNVILIVMDTVRAESLSLYGYERDTTPNLTRFAKRGTLFHRAFSTAPWTAPSHASLFTGRWPHELTIGWDRPLDSSNPTLAEILGRRGYATGGFVANTTYCSYETGLSRGFAHYEDYDVTLRGVLLCSSLVERSLNFLHKRPAFASFLGESGSSSGDRKSASRINRDFLGWLDRQKPERPFFAFLNFYDAHHPYLTPEPNPSAHFGREACSPRDFRLLKTWWERDKVGLKADDLQLARDSYDRCIASLDGQLALLFENLGRRGILENSVVIVTSDHGEHLGERNLFGHGCSVYRPELHVPLLIVSPRSLPEARIVEDPVSLRDIPTTVMELLDPKSPAYFPGQSLVRLAVQGSASEAPFRTVRSEVECPPEDDPNGGRSPASRGPMTSIVSRDFHYIKGGDGREELFDLHKDPTESRDLSSSPAMAKILGEFRESVRR